MFPLGKLLSQSDTEGVHVDTQAPHIQMRWRLAIGQAGNFSQAEQALVGGDESQAEHLGRRS